MDFHITATGSPGGLSLHTTNDESYTPGLPGLSYKKKSWKMDTMKLKTFKSDFILLVVASIWGLAFVAQRMGMDHVGPYTFNGIRFALGGISLIPFLIVAQKRREQKKSLESDPSIKEVLKGGVVAGIILFAGASLQQVGLVYTTAGKAGFITGLYVVIVPVLGLFLQQTSGAGIWFGAVLAAVGLYFLSITQEMTISSGDFLVFLSAFCFALHVIIIGKLSARIDTLRLSFVQCMLCSAASMAAAFLFEKIALQGILMAAVPIFYGGVFSVGIAYSLQIYGQKGSHPAHAAILMSLESVFAALGGWLILNEVLSGRALTGCLLMMAGMLVSQFYSYIVPKQGKE
ncbi:MAG: DMT family transporter [Thermodesulfobacteriota bacterium]|nr:DMT family transporter [Thermodesulfobacteriota bacterium]